MFWCIIYYNTLVLLQMAITLVVLFIIAFVPAKYKMPPHNIYAKRQSMCFVFCVCLTITFKQGESISYEWAAV